MLLLSVVGRIRTGKWERPDWGIVFFWPVMLLTPVFLVSEAVDRSKRRKRERASGIALDDLLSASIAALRIESDLEGKVIDACSDSLSAFRAGGYRTIHSVYLPAALGQFWNTNSDPFDFRPPPSSDGPCASRRLRPGEIVRYSPARRAGWLIAMSREFMKAIQSIDRKLQGRILEALAEISENPTVMKGDTIKPLTRELSGLWRYRLGDYRLIYQPLPGRNEILLVNFAARGSVYE